MCIYDKPITNKSFGYNLAIAESLFVKKADCSFDDHDFLNVLFEYI